jgi:hypothetical protein
MTTLESIRNFMRDIIVGHGKSFMPVYESIVRQYVTRNFPVRDIPHEQGEVHQLFRTAITFQLVAVTAQPLDIIRNISVLREDAVKRGSTAPGTADDKPDATAGAVLW